MSVALPKHIPGEVGYCSAIDIRQANVARWSLGQECPGKCSVKAWKRDQEPIAKWPKRCSAVLVPDPFSMPQLLISRLTEDFWNRNHSPDSFFGGVALVSDFPESVFAESDVAAVEVSLAFFAASAPFLYDSLR